MNAEWQLSMLVFLVHFDIFFVNIFIVTIMFPAYFKKLKFLFFYDQKLFPSEQ
jgi:hypothetical protein